MKQQSWPILLMVGGFGIAAISLACILFANASEAVRTALFACHAISIGVGSIGLGARISQSKKG